MRLFDLFCFAAKSDTYAVPYCPCWYKDIIVIFLLIEFLSYIFLSIIPLKANINYHFYVVCKKYSDIWIGLHCHTLGYISLKMIVTRC